MIDWMEVVVQGRRIITPRWLRTVGIAEDGRVFVPVALVDDKEALVCEWVQADGAALQRLGRHAYVDSDWVKERRPELAFMVDAVVSAARGIQLNGSIAGPL